MDGLRQFLWRALQLSIVIGTMIWLHLAAVEAGQRPHPIISLVIGVALAAVATGLMSGAWRLLNSLFRWLTRQRAIDTKRQRDHVAIESLAACRSGRQAPEPLPHGRIGQQLRKHIDVAPKP